MSKASWLKEFYPISVEELFSRTPEPTDVELVEHCLRKWEGATKENLKKHNLHKLGIDIFTNTKNSLVLSFGSDSCALCERYNQTDDDSCLGCPIYESRDGVACYDPSSGNDDSPYRTFLMASDAKPMIETLKIALEWAKNKEKNENKKVT